MKKLASLLALSSLGMFAIGCNDTAVDGPEPIPADSTDTGMTDDGMLGESGSGLATDDGAIDDAPPVTDEVPPAFTPEPVTPDATDDAPALEPTPETETPTLEEPATETPAIEEPVTEEPAAEASDSAEPAPAEEPAPQ